MSQHQSFRPSDFSFRGLLRDLPGFLVFYLVLSVAFVFAGLFIEALPSFLQGFLAGLGIALLLALFLVGRGKQVDVTTLPEASGQVRKLCDDTDCIFPSESFVEAVKLYRDDTGTSLTEATEMIKALVASRKS